MIRECRGVWENVSNLWGIGDYLSFRYEVME